MRLRYLLALVVAVLVSPFIIFSIWSSIERARLDRALDELEARGERLDVADFEAKPKTTEQRQASHLYAEAGKLVDDVSLSTFNAVGTTIEQLCGSSSERPDADLATLRAIENRYARALALLDRAAQLDVSGWDERDRPAAFSPTVIRTEQLAAINAVRIARRACGDDPAHAADALLSTLRLRRLPASPGMLRITQATYGLHLVLSVTPTAPAMLAAIQREFERDSDDRGLEDQMRSYRARWLADTRPGLFSEVPPGFGAQRLTPVQAILLRLSRPARDHVLVRELREFDEVIAAAGAPSPQRLVKAETLAVKYPRPRSGRQAVTDMLTRHGIHPANSRLQFVLPVMTESLARARVSIGAVAVARWRAEHQGAPPSSLRDLIPAYVSGPIIDPYSGAEVKYVVDGRAFKVYSVGSNREDDGGRWEQHSDLQLTRRGNPLDIGIAVTSAPKLP